jgi:bifunctional UDP-N-acetylglucosamine pyrophosphorylase/glucosamine-1-phosphate N-acetyltransferase
LLRAGCFIARSHPQDALSGVATNGSSGERVGLIVLAAGAGSRMKSRVPKPLHLVAGISMVERVLRAGSGADPDQIAVVVSPDTAPIIDSLSSAVPIIPVIQPQPRGTGEAVLLALQHLPSIDRAVILYCDHPLLEPRSVSNLLEGARTSGSRVTVLSATVPDAGGYGRVDRDSHGRVQQIVEAKDDDVAQRKGPTEINSGMMVVSADWAKETLQRVPLSDASQELYLTALVAAAVAEADANSPWPVTAVAGEPDDAMGVNDRIDLAAAESRAYARKREELMRAGVTMRLPESITIDESVEIGPDSVILPHTTIEGRTTIGAGSVIGPASVIRDSVLGDHVIVRSSYVSNSRIADDTDIGPYSHVRSNNVIGSHTHIGNFVELKNAQLADGVKIGHFSYVGDASLGADVNIGAGTVTANFDGVGKHRTTIGRRAFIGSDTILRAPVHVGDDARTGAGSVVTKDVPPGATAVGVPARIVRRQPVASEPGSKEE